MGRGPPFTKGAPQRCQSRCQHRWPPGPSRSVRGRRGRAPTAADARRTCPTLCVRPSARPPVRAPSRHQRGLTRGALFLSRSRTVQGPHIADRVRALVAGPVDRVGGPGPALVEGQRGVRLERVAVWQRARVSAWRGWTGIPARGGSQTRNGPKDVEARRGAHSARHCLCVVRVDQAQVRLDGARGDPSLGAQRLEVKDRGARRFAARPCEGEESEMWGAVSRSVRTDLDEGIWRATLPAVVGTGRRPTPQSGPCRRR